MNKPLQVLVVDKNQKNTEIIARALNTDQYNLHFSSVHNALALKSMLFGQSWDVVIYTHPFSLTGAREMLAIAQELQSALPVIFISSENDNDLAVHLIKAGASDYIYTKHIDRIPLAIERGLRDSARDRQKEMVAMALQESEQRWQFALEGAGDGVWDWNPITGLIVFTERCREMLGYSGTDHFDTFADWDRLLHPDDREQVYEVLYRHLEGLSPLYQCEYRLAAKDGSYKWILARGRVLSRTADGKASRVIGTHSDISARKQAEQELQAVHEQMAATMEELMGSEEKLRRQYTQLREQEQALRESEQLLADIISFLPDPTLVINREGEVLFWNKAMEKLTGVPKEKIIGRSNYEYAIPFYGHRRPILIDLVFMPPSEYHETSQEYGFISHEDNPLAGEGFVPGAYMGNGAYLLGSASRLYDLQGNTIGAIETIRDITERKHHEDALQKWAHIFEHAEWGIGVSSSEDLRLEMANPSLARMHGYFMEEIINQPVLILYPPECHPDIFEQVHQARQKGHHIFETLGLKKDGSVFPVMLDITAVKDADGNIQYMVGNVQDITRRKQKEEALINSEEKHRALINANPDLMFVFSEEGRILDFHVKHIEDLYANPQFFLNKTVTDVLPPDIARLTLEKIRRVKETGQVQIYEYELDLGSKRYFEARLLSYGKDEYLGIVRDNTERKLLENTIAEEAELRKMTLLSIGDGVISTDKNGRIKLLNKVAEHLTGWRQEEAFGRPLEEVFNTVNEFTREKCGNPVRQVLDTGDTVEISDHTILISADGIDIPIEDSAAPIKDESGNINGVVLVFRDFSEKKERQAKIEYLSFHDQLTGLYNRRFYEEELKRLDTQRNLPLTLVMGDINGLKLTNDAFGHLAGDRLLRKVATILRRECRADDIISRVGGDEFLIILPKTESEEAAGIVQRINEALLCEDAGAVPLSISFGWETKRTSSERTADVFKKAEDYMYRRKLSESASMRSKTVQVIFKTLYEKNEREQQHSVRVSQICEALGKALAFKPEDVRELKTVGLMHDIGKIILDDRILDKPGSLSEAEFLDVQRHAETGYRILSSVNEFAQLAEYVLAHHERWDGKGYPKGLQGEEIPLQARIIAVADAFDAMTSDRPYRRALSEEYAAEEIRKNAGTQFDPFVVRVFLEKIHKKDSK